MNSLRKCWWIVGSPSWPICYKKYYERRLNFLLVHYRHPNRPPDKTQLDLHSYQAMTPRLTNHANTVGHKPGYQKNYVSDRLTESESTEGEHAAGPILKTSDCA